MSADLQKLVEILGLARIGDNTFEGASVPARLNQIFGGQILAQALSAALTTVPAERRVHSSHAYFMRLGNPGKSVTFEVETVRDGGTFSTRRVLASQDGSPIFVTSLSFQVIEEGHNFQVGMPQAIAPEELIDDIERWNRVLQHTRSNLKPVTFRPIEIRHTSPIDWFNPARQSPVTGVWLRANGRLPEDPRTHQSVLAYLSDFYLYGTSLRPHGLSLYSPNIQPASLDHSMWFHGEFRADEWLYYHLESTWTGNARGLSFGKFYTRDGRLVASTAQEGLMRVRKDR
jgi:acyl-CoA thioesterase-2